MNYLVLLFVWLCWSLIRFRRHRQRRPSGLRWHNWADIIIPPPLGWIIYRRASAHRRLLRLLLREQRDRR